MSHEARRKKQLWGLERSFPALHCSPIILSPAVFRAVPLLTERLKLALPAIPPPPVKPDKKTAFIACVNPGQNRRLMVFSDFL